MLYIFLVDTGTMLNFDMNLAVESVSHLQAAIADECQIPVDKQVLLISGGENLDPVMRVCSYHAGTDTNPIFLFSKSTIESAAPPSPSVYAGSDGDLRYQVEGSIIMQPSFETVVSRVQLALQIADLAQEEVSCCESLVHDQHLQQQGWAAVVANLEDISSAFRQRSTIFKQNFEDFLLTRAQYFTMLSDFNTVLALLSKMPLLPCLSPRQQQERPTDLSKCITLLQWISSQDQRSTLQQMAEHCLKALEQFDKSVLNNLMTEINTALEGVDNASMKEIKGLGDRLYGLEQLMAGARKIVQDQGEMAQGFVQNQERVRILNDPSILPDLCSSHQKQLMVMLKNHSQLRDIRRRCTLAKEELSVNLHARLRWIMYVEKQISDIDSKMVIYHENLKRLRRRLEVVEQIDMSPKLYAMAVVEVYRRKLYSSKFMQWATKLTDESSHIQGQEVSRRMEFAAIMGKHFLHGLFPGIDDYPSAFASEMPESFDSKLPDITDTDISQLRQQVPELSNLLRVPSVENFKKAFEEHHQEVLILKSLTARSPLKELPEGNDASPIAVADSSHHKDGTDVAKVTKDSKVEEEDDLKRLSLSFEKVENVLDEEFHKMAEEQRQSLIKTDERVQESSKDTTPTQSDRSLFLSLTDQNEEFMSASQSLLPELTTLGRHEGVSAVTTDLQTNLMQKSVQLIKVQQELEATKTSLLNEQEKFKKLLLSLEKTRSEMKLDMKSIEADIKEERTKYGTFVGDARDKFIQAVNTVKVEHEREKQDLKATVEKVKQSSNEMEEMYQKKLQEQLSQCTRLEQQATQLKEELKCSGDNAHALQQNYESQMQELSKKFLDEKSNAVAVIKQDLSSQIQEMSVDIKAKEKVIAELALEKDQLAKDLTAGFERSKKELEMRLRAEAEIEERNVVQETEKRVTSVLKEETEKLKCDYEGKMKTMVEESKREKGEMRKEMELKHAKDVEEMKETFETQKKQELECLRQLLEKEHETDIAKLTEKCKADKQEYMSNMQSKVDERLAACMMEESFHTDKQSAILDAVEKERRKHEETLNQMRTDSNEERDQAIAAAVEMERQRHHAEMEEFIRSHEKDKQDSLTSMKNSLQAEKQVSFNEAVAKVGLEKAKIIAELERKVEELLSQQQESGDALARVLAGNADVDEETKRSLTQSQEREALLKSRIGTLEKKLDQAEKKLEVLEGRVPLQRERPPSMTFEKLPDGILSASAHSDITNTSLDSRDRHHMLEVALRAKEEECSTLNQRLLQLTRAVSAKADKVSIQNFSIGDIVLICFDEYRENYIIFTIGPILYFVHSDSVAGLELKPQSGKDRKLWVLGQITDKEYCQAKKAQNRFKVPPGTKFYRVKAAPWPKKT